MKIKIIFTLAICLVSISVSATESVQEGAVTELRISSTLLVGGNPTHFKLSGVWEAQGCANAGYWAIDTDTTQGKAMLSVLLAAKAMGSTLRARNLGSGDCSLRSDMRDVIQLDVVN
jgi:hypothetical protein